MKRKTTALLGIIILSFFLTIGINAQTQDRSEVPEEYTWDLTHLYPTDEAWAESKTKLAAQLEKLTEFKGTLSSSAAQLFACLDFLGSVSKQFSRWGSYAGMKSDQDTRDSKYMAMRQEIQQLGTMFGAKASFIEPEIVAMDKETIDKFQAEEPKLAPHRFSLYDLMRQKEHTLSEKEERIMAEAGRMAGAPYSIFSIFSNAELPYPKVTLSDGTEATLDKAGYFRYRTLSNREDRELVFNEFYAVMNKFKGTIGAQLYGGINRDLFYTKARGYESCLERALDANNIPVEVYHALIENVNENLDAFHRYLKIKKRMLGVETLKYSDLYAPTVKGVELEYDIKTAKKLILDSLKLLGKEYLSTVQRAYDERWIDVYPTTGKRSGAYSNDGSYDVHPYILMNFNGLYSDVSTLTHELGHALHSYFAFKTQPYPTADYSIFVAEVASTFNEALLMDKVLKETEDDDVRLSLLMEYLDGMKGTVWRQTQFAEFELRLHEKVEKGEALTGDNISEIYREIVQKYYGHDEGVCHVQDFIDYEWSIVPHFYMNYYVYQYATSFTASKALAEGVLNREEGAVDKFIQFLSAGASDYPIAILKQAGVDMTTAEPFQKTMQAMNRTIDEIEKILDKKGL